MEKLPSKRFLALAILLGMSVVFLPGCLFHRHRGSDLATQVNPGDQPDKILYEKATNEIDHSRYDVGRLTLQTLINTYPDSEFLAKAKLAIADSYYNEGGVSGLTQSEAEYKDFITFFPTAPEAPEAQYRVGMAHFRLMAKPDRDRTEAKLAEVEFKEFLLKYPDSPLMPRVKGRLRMTQEILAQGDFSTAQFYYMRGALPAAESRFQEIVEKYPNFSRGDSTLYYLGQTLEKLRKQQAAIPYYAQIITDFPLSPYVDEAKERLTTMHQPIPRPTKAMLARAKADAARRTHQDLFSKVVGVMSSSPDTSSTLRGPVRLGSTQPGTVEVAKTPPGGTPSGASIAVQPVGEESLKAGKAIDPKSNAANSNGNGKDKAQQENSENSKGEESASAPAKKKKGPFGIFKKIIKPF